MITEDRLIEICTPDFPDISFAEIEEILKNQGDAEKYKKLRSDLQARLESNQKQRMIELESETGSEAFAYQLEWNINLINSILNYEFWKGVPYLELEQENKQLRETNLNYIGTMLEFKENLNPLFVKEIQEIQSQEAVKHE